MKRVLSLGLAALLILSGCSAFGGDGGKPVVTEQDPQPRWDLTVFITNYEPEVGGTFNGSVAVGGQFEGKVSGVTIAFLNEDKEVIKEIPVGNITSIGERKSVNTTLPSVPVIVVPRAEDWDTPGTEPNSFHGQRITADGGLEVYRVTGDDRLARDGNARLRSNQLKRINVVPR